MPKKRAPKVIRDHWDRVADLGCVITARPNPTIHHAQGGSMTAVAGLKGTGLKASDWLAIPLDAEYHTGKYGIDSSMGVLTWEKRFGKQVDYLDKISRFLGYNVWKKAGINREIPEIDKPLA